MCVLARAVRNMEEVPIEIIETLKEGIEVAYDNESNKNSEVAMTKLSKLMNIGYTVKKSA